MNAPTKTVLVQCIWPAERGPKDDCRGGTGIVWAGHGDVKEYPAALWPRLAAHPDVWRLFDAEADAKVAAAREAALKAQRAAEAAAEAAARAAQEAEAELARKAAEAGAGTGTDVITATVLVELTADQLAAMSDDDIRVEAAKRGYELHPRLNPENLRKRFLEAQEAAAGATAE